MKLDFLYWAVAGLVWVVCLSAIGWAIIAPSYTCRAKAEVMGMKSSWGFVQGCMIEVKPGQWVPLSNYRVL